MEEQKITKTEWVYYSNKLKINDIGDKVIGVYQNKYEEATSPTFLVGVSTIKVASVQTDRMMGYEFEEAEANAKLIAAAPDLLEICKLILEDDYKNAILTGTNRIKIKKAIQKATE